MTYKHNIHIYCSIVADDVLISNSGRVRNVIQAPDGSIYVSVENPGRIIQIVPE